jgi:hypothetical protein
MDNDRTLLKPDRDLYMTTPTTWRARFERLVFDLWRDDILTEQQCAKYADTDIVSVRRILDCQALLFGFKSRDEAQAWPKTAEANQKELLSRVRLSRVSDRRELPVPYRTLMADTFDFGQHDTEEIDLFTRDQVLAIQRQAYEDGYMRAEDRRTFIYGNEKTR